MPGIPENYEQITTEWLNQALTETEVLTDGATISDFRIEPVGEGLGYLSFLFRIRPIYSATDSNLPETMIVKFPSTEEGSRTTGNSLRAFERESLFYEHCSADSPCAPPTHYYSHSNPATDEYLLIMGDLDGCRFVSQVDGVQKDDALRCFQALAEHHAYYWNKTDQLDWAPLYSEYGDLYRPLLETGAPLMKQNWAGDLSSIYLDHEAQALALYPQITQRLQLLPTTLIHCDPRIENIAFSGTKPHFYDWQLAARGPAAYDLMYFFKQSMDADLRRQCQDELFDAYLEVLTEHGVQYSKEQLLHDIGLATCTIWAFMAMIGNFFYRNELNEEIWKITLPRYMAMIEDFGGIEKLKAVSQL